MTISFWLALVLLVALALAFLFYPLLFVRQKRSVLSRREQNLAAYRGRMQELEDELEAGVIDPEMFDRLKAEMEANLLEDVDGNDETVASASASSPRLLWPVTLVAALFVPVVSFVLYDSWGAHDALAQTQVMNQMVAGEGMSEADMNQLVSQLRQRLERNPDNADGWLLLARTEMQMGQYRQAAEAYERLAGLALEEQSADAAAAWGLAAQAHFFAAQGRLDQAAQEAVRQAQNLDPNEVNTLGLLGINAFQSQNYREAIDFWGRILELEPDHPQNHSIRDGIAMAYSQLGEPVPDAFLTGPAEPLDASRAPAGDAFVQVSVLLSEHAEREVGENDVLYVYARALDGPPRPLAIARLTVADLPADIRLDDTMAMMPEDALQAGQEVMVVARVSRDGTATPKPGDWEGEIGPLQVGENQSGLVLRVDQPVR